MTLQERHNIIREQLISSISENTCYGVNPFNVQIVLEFALPDPFNISCIKIKYHDSIHGRYLDSNWYNNQIYEPLIFRGELDNIEVSIVNLNDKQGNPLTQQLIIIA